MADEDYFPELWPWDAERIQALGYLLSRISVFDHILTEQEAGECDWMSHDIAEGQKDAEIEYQRGEDRFLAFYRGLIGKDEVVVNDRGHVYRTRGERLINMVVIPSLRERSLMDLFVERANTRIVGGYDRTDLLLARDEANRAALGRRAMDAGLFILD